MVVALLSLDHGYTPMTTKQVSFSILPRSLAEWLRVADREGLSVYLDEMVGLNVLIPATSPRITGFGRPMWCTSSATATQSRNNLPRVDLSCRCNTTRVSRRRLSEYESRRYSRSLNSSSQVKVMPKACNGSRDKYAVAVIGSPALGIDSTSNIDGSKQRGITSTHSRFIR